MAKEATRKARKLTPAREASSLAVHGTKVWELSPAAVIQAAEQDIKTVKHNAEVKAHKAELKREGKDPKLAEKEYRTAFVPGHVKGKKTARDIIAAALGDLGKGMSDRDNPNRFRLYNNADLLRAALNICDTPPQ